MAGPGRKPLPGPAVWALAVAIVVAAGVAGLLIGTSGDGGGDGGGGGKRGSQSVTAGDLRLRLPSGWSKRSPDAGVGELGLQNALSAGPTEATGAELVAGTIDDKGGPGSPWRATLERFDPTPPRADLATLGDLPAYRYPALVRPGSDRRTTLYVVPRRENSVAVACSGPSDAPESFFADCEAAAASLEIRGGAGSVRDERERYLTQATPVIRRLSTTRTRLRRSLAQAGTPDAQAEAASSLARAYRQAARRMNRIDATATALVTNSRLTRDLFSTALAYRRLAGAARRDAREDYRAARSAIRRGESRIEARLASL